MHLVFSFSNCILSILSYTNFSKSSSLRFPTLSFSYVYTSFSSSSFNTCLTLSLSNAENGSAPTTCLISSCSLGVGSPPIGTAGFFALPYLTKFNS